jgi:hypothetical protein
MSTPTSKLYPHGYYKVGAEIFNHKISALLRATETRTRPTWHFHDDVYNGLNWEEDLPISLPQIYQQRAKQLREKYDYITISFSGGSDSWTVVNAFISSNTYIDEIFVRWPVAATQKHQVNANDTSAGNVISEWELAIVPSLKKIRDLIPNTKITIHDWSNEILTSEVTDKNWVEGRDYLNPGNFLKFQAISKGEQQAIDKGLKTAIVIGIDKPQLWAKDGNIYCYFLDKLANVQATGENRVSESFYWTPDFPEITLVQSRLLFKYIKHNPAVADLIDRNKPYNPETKGIWNNVARSIIYQEYSQLGVWQSKKPIYNIRCENDAFMHASKDEKYLQSWKYGLSNVISSISSEYFEHIHGNVDNFGGFISGTYYLGNINRQD